ncbi:MAG: GGDEF domain-containing protein [Anaerolineae bacterium]
MKDDPVLQIAELCMAIDKQAAQVYMGMAASSSNPKLLQFWRGMAEVEQRHLTFWNGVQSVAEGHPLPTIFDDPARTRKDLERLLTRVTEAIARWEKAQTVRASFLLAFQLELTMAHRAFPTFYYTLGPLVRAANPEDDYQLHIDALVQMAAWYQEEAPELDLLSETLNNLWETNKLLTRFSTIDSLTGLLSRYGFFLFARQLAYLSQRNKESVGLLIVEVDRLSEINQRYGLDQGDQVLRAIAEVLKTNLRRSDVVGRSGGEGFVLFFPEIQPEAVGRLAEQLRAQIEMAKPAGTPVTVSIGAAHAKMLLSPEEDLDLMIARATQSLAAARASGTNRVAVSE